IFKIVYPDDDVEYEVFAIQIQKINLIIKNNYFVTKTGQFAYVTTPEAVLPNSNFLTPDLPLVPITIKSIFSCSAYCIISPYTAISVTITFVNNLITGFSFFTISSVLLSQSLASSFAF